MSLRVVLYIPPGRPKLARTASQVAKPVKHARNRSFRRCPTERAMMRWLAEGHWSRRRAAAGSPGLAAAGKASCPGP